MKIKVQKKPRVLLEKKGKEGVTRQQDPGLANRTPEDLYATITREVKSSVSTSICKQQIHSRHFHPEPGEVLKEAGTKPTQSLGDFLGRRRGRESRGRKAGRDLRS